MRQLATVAEATSVHIVFVSASSDPQVIEALAKLAASGVLTVGESPDFATAGGIITFVLEADKVRFEINQQASEHAGLKVSAQLLKLATVVHRKS